MVCPTGQLVGGSIAGQVAVGCRRGDPGDRAAGSCGAMGRGGGGTLGRTKVVPMRMAQFERKKDDERREKK